jgi:hypothetical protein
MTLSKPFGILAYEKEQLENYNPSIVEECDTEDEAAELFERSYADADNAAKGYEMVYKDGNGAICHYSGDLVEMLERDAKTTETTSKSE